MRKPAEIPAGAWCSQHHQERSLCRPGDRHVQSFRASDELIAAVAARAAEMGLSRQDGFEMALEEFVGWRKPGEPWRGPAQWTLPERAASKAATVRNLGARLRQERQDDTPASREPGGKRAVAAVPDRKKGRQS